MTVDILFQAQMLFTLPDGGGQVRHLGFNLRVFFYQMSFSTLVLYSQSIRCAATCLPCLSARLTSNPRLDQHDHVLGTKVYSKSEEVVFDFP